MKTQASSSFVICQRSEVANTSSVSVTVPKTNNVQERKYEKRFYCMFCSKPLAKLPRHLIKQHATEEEVFEYEKETDMKEKNKKLERIRTIGNHIHNREVIRSGEGQLAVQYRPTNEGVAVDDFSPCPYCFGYFRRKDLWRHKCTMKPEKNKQIKKISVASRLLLPLPASSSHQLNVILSNMRADNISRIVKSDSTICKYGERLANKHGHDTEQHNYIRQKLRVLGRLVEHLRSLDNSPKKF